MYGYFNYTNSLVELINFTNRIIKKKIYLFYPSLVLVEALIFTYTDVLRSLYSLHWEVQAIYLGIPLDYSSFPI